MKKLAFTLAAAFALSGVAATASAQSHDHGMHSGGSWHGGGHSGGDWHGGDHGNWHGDWHGGHRFFGPRIGFSFGFPAYPYWGPYYGYYGYPYPYAYPYPYDAYPYYDSGPQVYIQRDSGDAVAPTNPARPSDYSYYCTDPAGYYPQVASCPSGWLKVVPNGPPPR